MNDWISVKDKLPEPSGKYDYTEPVLVLVHELHSPHDFWDCEFAEDEFVAFARFDYQQKIWNLIEADEYYNALLDDESITDGRFITHWMPLPDTINHYIKVVPV